jgi:hypothetical protein
MVCAFQSVIEIVCTNSDHRTVDRQVRSNNTPPLVQVTTCRHVQTIGTVPDTPVCLLKDSNEQPIAALVTDSEHGSQLDSHKHLDTCQAHAHAERVLAAASV